MTLALCDYLASTIRDGASVQSGIAENINSSLFNKAERGRVTIPPYTWLQEDIDSDIYVCHGGFDSQYEKPHGKGGRYATLEDIRNLFSIGIEHGRAKALGSKPHFDADFAKTIGGYPKGSIVYTDGGIRMVNRLGQNTIHGPQADGTTDRFWARVDPTATFYPGWDVHSGVRLESGVVLPTKPTTTNFLAAVITADKVHTSPGRIVVFTYSATYFIYSDGRTFTDFVNLCIQGRMSVRLSLYDDIYTNPSHADEYIEVLSCETHRVSISGVTDSIAIRSPHMAVPLHPDKTYYVFVGYENGCASSNVKEDNNHHITGGFLNTYALDRGLDWTKV